MTQARELLQRVILRAHDRGRKDARAGPRSFCAGLGAIDDPHALAVLRKLVSQRQANHAAADNQDIVHSDPSGKAIFEASF